MEPGDEATITLTQSELYLLIEGLDAYEYWQLGDVLPRNNGAVFLPDDDFGDRYWSQGRAADRGAARGDRRVCADAVPCCSGSRTPAVRRLESALLSGLMSVEPHTPRQLIGWCPP